MCAILDKEIQETSTEKTGFVYQGEGKEIEPRIEKTAIHSEMADEQSTLS